MRNVLLEIINSQRMRNKNSPWSIINNRKEREETRNPDRWYLISWIIRGTTVIIHDHVGKGSKLKFLRSSLAALSGLLRKKVLVNIGEDTTLSNGDVTEKLVQFLVIADGKLEMTWDDAGLLVVAGGVASQFQDFSSKILKDGSEIDRGTRTNPLGVVALPQETMNTTNGESETGLGGSALGLFSLTRSGLATRFSTGHFGLGNLERN
jgi:hypothetical protein